MLVARLFGIAAVKLGQPRVMGEVVAGITLGPTILGALLPGVQAAIFPTRHPAVARRGRQPRPGLLHVPRRPGARPGAAARAHRPGGRDLQRQRRAADDARHRRRPADLRAGRPRQGVRRVRAVHGRGDVDHRVPGARAHPGRAADAQAAGRRAHAGLRRDRRRHRVVPDRAGHRRRHRRRRGRRRWRRSRLAVAFCLFMAVLVRPLLGRVSTAFDEAGRVPGRLDRGDLRRRPAVGLRHRGDRHRA